MIFSWNFGLKGQKGGTWGALPIGTFGLGLIIAGIFSA
jgi:hypothetical protein